MNPVESLVIAHRVAWAAVKKVYVKVGTEWLPR